MSKERNRGHKEKKKPKASKKTIAPVTSSFIKKPAAPPPKPDQA